MASRKPPHNESGTRKIKTRPLSSWVSSILSGFPPQALSDRQGMAPHFSALGTPSMLGSHNLLRRGPSAPASWTARTVGTAPAWRAKPSTHSRTDRAERLARVGSLIEQSRRAPSASPSSQSGVALMELMLVVGTIMVVSGGVFAVYRVADASEKVARETQNAEEIVQNLTSVMATSQYKLLSDTAKAVELGIIPDRMIDGTGVSSVWGDVSVEPYTVGGAAYGSTLLTYANVPASACSRFIANVGPGFHTIKVNDAVLSQNFSALSPAAIANLCSTSRLNKVELVHVKDGGTGIALAPVASCAPQAPETQVVPTCPPGQLGETTQKRDFVCLSPYGPATPTPWTNISSTCAPICVPSTPVVTTATESQSSMCLSGRVTSSGSSSFPQTRTRTTTVNYSCPAPTGPSTANSPVNTYSPWSPTESSACGAECTAPAPSSAPITRAASNQTQTIGCPVGQSGATTQERTRVENGTRTTNWTCPAPTGPSNSTTSDSWLGTYTATGSWTPVSSTCAPNCVAPPTSTTTGTQSASCASGRLTPAGNATFTQTRSVTVSYSCPAPTGAYSTNPATYGAWSPLETEACAPTCVAPSSTTQSGSQTATCPAGTYVVGQSTAVSSFTQTHQRSVSYSCPQATGAYATNYGTWSTWDPTVAATCDTKCTAPPTSVTYTPQGNTATCPSGQLTSSGSSTFVQSRTRTNTTTYSCPTYTGDYTTNPTTYTYTSFTPTAAQVCFSACVAPPPSTETTPAAPEYRTLNCPAAQYGQIDQSRWVTQSRSVTNTCPAPTGSYSTTYGPWGAPYTYGTFTTTSTTCTNCPPAVTETQNQWASPYNVNNCPAGAYGFTTRDRYQSSTRTKSYSCPAGTRTLPAASYTAWSAWANTGTTRLLSSSCTNCPAPVTETQWSAPINYNAAVCAAGQYGHYVREYRQYQQRTRSYTCPSGTSALPPASYTAWGAWTNGPISTVANNCVTCPAPATETQNRWASAYNVNNCPAGTYGYTTRDRYQSSTRTRSYTCPAGSASLPAATYTAWSAWANTGATRQISTSCTNCPADQQITQDTWAYRAGPACPNPYWTGVNGWDEIMRRTYYRNWDCPAGSASLPAYYNDRFTPYAWTGTKANVTSCALPACGTTLETQAKYYMARYQDLYNAFNGNWTAAKNHWNSNGYYEGRVSCWAAPYVPPPPPTCPLCVEQ